MKESEAKTRWCPMVRYSVTDTGNFNNRGGNAHPDDHFCIGSACMMWEDHTPDKIVRNSSGKPQKYHFEPTEVDNAYVSAGIYKPVKVDNEWELHRVSDESRGDCGLKTKESGCFYQN